MLGGLPEERVAVEKAFCYALEGTLLDSEEAGGMEGIFRWLGEDAVVVCGHCGGGVRWSCVKMVFETELQCYLQL